MYYFSNLINFVVTHFQLIRPIIGHDGSRMLQNLGSDTLTGGSTIRPHAIDFLVRVPDVIICPAKCYSLVSYETWFFGKLWGGKRRRRDFLKKFLVSYEEKRLRRYFSLFINITYQNNLPKDLLVLLFAPTRWDANQEINCVRPYPKRISPY